MKDQLVLRVVAQFLTPFIVLYGLYVQLHGEYSPGGGFQAGVIVAVAFVLFCLIMGLKRTLSVIPLSFLKKFAAFGVLLYAGVGVVTMLKGGSFLEYGVLASDPVSGQKMGIFLVELGVGVTVFSVMLMLFFLFVQRHLNNKG